MLDVIFISSQTVKLFDNKYSSEQENACYIGAESRKAYRQKQIDQLTEEIEIAEKKYNMLI